MSRKNRSIAHEAFQGIIERGVHSLGGEFIGTNTTGSADGIIFNRYRTGLSPIVLEVKTRDRSDYHKGTQLLTEPQIILLEKARSLDWPFVHVVAYLRIEGFRQQYREPYGTIEWTVNGETEGPMAERYKTWLTECVNHGYREIPKITHSEVPPVQEKTPDRGAPKLVPPTDSRSDVLGTANPTDGSGATGFIPRLRSLSIHSDRECLG